jgi:hypothetical protein
VPAALGVREDEAGGVPGGGGIAFKAGSEAEFIDAAPRPPGTQTSNRPNRPVAKAATRVLGPFIKALAKYGKIQKTRFVL